MAYAAVISLKNTLNSFLYSYANMSVLSTTREPIEFAYKEVVSLEEVLVLLDTGLLKIKEEMVRSYEAFEFHLSNEFPSEYQLIQFAYKHILSSNYIRYGRMNVRDRQIREAANNLAAALKTLVSKFKQQPVTLSREVETVNQAISSFTKVVKNRKGVESQGEQSSSSSSSSSEEEEGESEEGSEEESEEESTEDGSEAESEEEEEHANPFDRIKKLRKEIEFLAYEVRIRFDVVLQRLDMNRSSRSLERLNAIGGEIREAAFKFQDLLESYVSSQFYSHYESYQPTLISLDLQELEQDIDSFTKSVKLLKKEYYDELVNPLPEQEEEDNDATSSRNFFAENKSKMVGFPDIIGRIKEKLTNSSPELKFVTLLGMAGIGKTTIVKEVCEDPLVLKGFDRRAWVTVGPKYQPKNIVRCILAQVNPRIIDKMLTREDEKLTMHLNASLKGKRYLIVLDDVWNTEVWDYLKRLLPDDNNRSRVLLTTRIQQVAGTSNMRKMRLLNKEESWELLREKIFGKNSCPYQLEIAGKKIADKCDGLPLTIVTVADILSKADDKTPEYWERVADKQNSVFKDAYDQMTEVLLPSYTYLPQHLKACFLYMGVFPEKYKISRSALDKLWSTEGFLDQHVKRDDLDDLLEVLVDSSVLMVHQEGSINKIKTCRLHSAFSQLCQKEAERNKFFFVICRYADCLEQGMESQRRLCILKNVLFGIKDVYESMSSISAAHSLLCTGPYHQYPVPLCFNLKLLGVLNAFSIRFYEFPMEVLELFHLKYLAVTCYGEIPPSISKLWNLEVLIVLRHLSIKFYRARSYLPKEIWNMKKIKHIQVVGCDLPNTSRDALSENLLTLPDVSTHSCTKGVLKRLPNLKKLGVRIELAPDSNESLRCFDHISHLDNLESLKCVIVNPNLRYAIVKPPASNSIFPESLLKLCLSGFGYPWESMRVISSLPNLQVIKLRIYAFRGPKWEVEANGFPSLVILIIEDTDLVHWSAGRGSFLKICRFSLKNCYKLEEIPQRFGKNLLDIELVDCNPLAVTSATKIKKRRAYINLNVHSPMG